jgi:hypothetical protein
MLDRKVAEGIDLTSVDAITAKAVSLASRSDATVNETFASLMFMAGESEKTTPRNAPFDVKAAFNALAAVHYSEAYGRKPLTAKTTGNYQSAFANYYAIGKLPYDATSIANFGMDKLKGNYGSRGKVLKTIMAAHPTVCPTEAELAAYLPADKPKTLYAAAAKAQKILLDAAGDDGDFAAVLVKFPQADLALADAMANIATAIKHLPADDGEPVVDLAARAEAKRQALVPTPAPKKVKK